MSDIIQKVKNLSIGFKSKKGEEILGYLINSYDQLIEELVKKIEENGGKILLNSKVISINHKSNKVSHIRFVQSNTMNKFDTDLVVATIPNYELKNLVLKLIKVINGKNMDVITDDIYKNYTISNVPKYENSLIIFSILDEKSVN